jgi:hypothetical protein
VIQPRPIPPLIRQIPRPSTRLIVACDFNGVIHDHRDGPKDKVDPASPAIPGAIDWLKAVSEELDVFLVSASFAKSPYVTSARAWLTAQGIPADWTTPVVVGRSRITLTPFKPPCLLFIDDRGFCFRGEFPEVEDIKRFVPWNRIKG